GADGEQQNRPQRRPNNRRSRGPAERTRGVLPEEAVSTEVDAEAVAAVDVNVDSESGAQPAEREGSERPRRDRRGRRDRRPREDRGADAQAAEGQPEQLGLMDAPVGEATAEQFAEEPLAIAEPQTVAEPVAPVSAAVVANETFVAVAEPVAEVTPPADKAEPAAQMEIAMPAPEPVAAVAPAASVTEVAEVAPAAPVTSSAAVATAATTKASGGRAGNDPRVNRREIHVTIETKALQIDYTQAPPAQPDAARTAVTRASNDPRLRRNTTA